MSELWDEGLPQRSPAGGGVLGWALRQVFLWTVVAVFGFAAFSYRHVLFGRQDVSAPQKVERATPRTRDGSRPASRTLTVRAGSGGHFLVAAQVDGARVPFIIDTGATEVMLTPEDARRIGFDLRARNFTRRFHTAGGVVRAAPVTLRRLRIGQLTLRDVEAWVNETPLPMSLLGMSFLKRLDGYEVEGGTLTLYW